MAFFTDSLGFVKQIVGENPTTWGSVLNSQFIDMADEAIAGLATIDVTSADQTLELLDGVSSDARAMILEVVGAPPSPRTVTVPSVQKLYAVHNGTGQDLTIQTATGSGLVLEDGSRVLVLIDDELDQPVLVAVGERVVAAGPDEFTAITCTVDNVLLGDTTPGYLTYTEGTLTTLRTLGFNVVVDATTFVVRPVGVVFIEQIFPQDLPMVIRENGSLVHAYARLAANAIGFFKVDGTNWVVGSQRIVYSHDWTYSTAVT